MSKPDFSYASWRDRRGRTTERLARLNAGLPPYRRERLRGAAEAEALRRRGTPEALIGPIGSDAKVAQQRAGLVAFARRLRAASGRAN